MNKSGKSLKGHISAPLFRCDETKNERHVQAFDDIWPISKQLNKKRFSFPTVVAY
ncbi:hypothetical protein THOB06_50175 [Vibrio rotiferianus]|nr:hypothetical protein THOG10_50175 [Vibrio rotiferianus]CAH1591761.1 hypothetical protein THOB06_50175 [Vibrio rotiferianus]